MTHAVIQMFMGKLKQLINCNDNPLINNPAIICERPHFQILYEDLGSMFQTLFIDQHQDIEKVIDLKKRFTDAAHDAEYIVDLFLSRVHISNNNEHVQTSGDFNLSLSLDDVRRSLESVKVELTSMKIDNMNLDSSRTPKSKENQSAAGPSSFTRTSQGSTKLVDENVVGLDGDLELIRDKLVEDQKKVGAVSIVGMGGIGKTTLATKVFNDRFVVYHFHIRIWVTVSQTYDRQNVLVQILESIGVKLDLENTSVSRLREIVHKLLMGKRYLIVIDDIWHKESWNDLISFFPHDNTGSRILLTSRLTEVAKHANSDGLIHHLGYLNKENSWELLRKKVFHGNEFPEWSIKPGMQIVENCQGLPLAVVVIAGVLAKEEPSENFWVEIAYSTGSYIVGDPNGFLNILALSYIHLPLHLRECFLYFGGFPEYYMFQVERLIWLWVAEGFIQENGNRRLEDIAQGYLMDLIDRNLVIVGYRSKSNGVVKVCILHDLIRELCLQKAQEERFMIKVERQTHSFNATARSYKLVRMFINSKIRIVSSPYPSTQNLRSVLCFGDLGPLSDDIAKYFCSFVLLRVLDFQKCPLKDFSECTELLVHLRYLAIWNSSADFPSSICRLWNLQTLIYITNEGCTLLPSNISDLVNLRHLLSDYPPMKGMKVRKSSRPYFIPSNEKSMDLQTISNVMCGEGVSCLQKYFPCIKELTFTASLHEENDFKSLTFLEKLNLSAGWRGGVPSSGTNHITFPETLYMLTLGDCRLPWSDMSIIQSLPNLRVLKLTYNAFEGSCWNTDEHEFGQLTFLRLEVLDIKLWEVDSKSFPCLKQLQVFSCNNLEEIPIEFGEIPTLELIKIKNCSYSVCESVERIQEMQSDSGNEDLKIDVSDDSSL